MGTEDRRRGICRPLRRKISAYVPYRRHRKGDGSLTRGREQSSPERPCRRRTGRLLMRTGDSELGVIGPGGGGIGQTIDRSHQHEESEQPFQAAYRCGAHCRGSTHCAKHTSNAPWSNSRAPVAAYESTRNDVRR